MGMTNSVGWHHEVISRQCDLLDEADHLPEWGSFEFQVAIPGKRHEDVRRGQQESVAEHIAGRCDAL